MSLAHYPNVPIRSTIFKSLCLHLPNQMVTVPSTTRKISLWRSNLAAQPTLEKNLASGGGGSVRKRPGCRKIPYYFYSVPSHCLH